MLAIIDSRAPKAAKQKLKREFEVFEFESNNITYNEVSGHPDIFMCKNGSKIVVSPNSPKAFLDLLTEKKVNFSLGKKQVGIELHNSTQYNCIAGGKYLLHKKGFTDKTVEEVFDEKEFINLPQAYTRCSLSRIDDNTYITSDKGIEKILKEKGFDTLAINPKSILLPGFPYGFFGGTNGIFKNKFYLIGSLKYHSHGNVIRDFLEKHNLEIIELYNGPLYDGGGIFFIEN